MIGFVLRRVGGSLVLLFLVLTVTFFVIHLAPGDPADLLVDPRTPEENRDRLRRLWGLDRPLGEQYVRWLSAVAQGDWGTSFNYQEPVIDELAGALPNTLVLALGATLVAFGLGIPLGIVAARRHNQTADHALRVGSLLVYSLPTFWLGLMAILLFSYLLPILPASHMHSVGSDSLSAGRRFLDLLYHLTLPALILGAPLGASITRFVRNSLLELFGQDFLQTARAKGLSEVRVVWVHGLRNALVPVVQILGLQLPALLNGALVVEVVFSWPGLGRVVFNSLQARDYPMIMAATAFTGFLVVAGTLLADLVHAVADPRVRDD